MYVYVYVYVVCCVLRVCGMCVLCFGVVVYCCVHVVCVVCGVCGAAWHAENTTIVGSKRLRV